GAGRALLRARRVVACAAGRGGARDRRDGGDLAASAAPDQLRRPGLVRALRGAARLAQRDAPVQPLPRPADPDGRAAGDPPGAAGRLATRGVVRAGAQGLLVRFGPLRVVGVALLPFATASIVYDLDAPLLRGALFLAFTLVLLSMGDGFERLSDRRRPGHAFAL